jgi:MFS family permease
MPPKKNKSLVVKAKPKKAVKKELRPPRWPLFVLYVIGFLLAISAALPTFIQSNFLQDFVSLRMVSVFFVLANALTIGAMLAFPKIIRELSNYFTTKIVLIFYVVALLSLTIADSPALALFGIILVTIASNLIWINLDLLVEKFSVDESTGRTRTIYMTFINAGWILAPTFSSYLIKIGTYELPFFISAFLVLPIFLILLGYGRQLNGQVKYRTEKLATAIKKMWANKNLRGIFFIALFLQLFYSLAVVYVPVYLHQTLGMGWNVIGPIFSVMLIPFVLFEIPAGIIADKYLGEKELLSVGLFIITVSLFLFFYLDSPIAWVWAATLFLSRIGAALVESMRDTYFFKLVGAKDVGYINLFRLSGPVAYIIGPGIAILVLSFLPINYIFLTAAIIMLASFYFVSSIKDTK